MAGKELKVSEALRKKLNDIANNMGSGSVKVGFFENQAYSDGTPVAAVAFWNEFGHQGPFPAPPRPFFRPMISHESPGWPKTMAALAKSTNYDGHKVLTIMGQDIAAALEDSIRNAPVDKLSDTTLRLREKFGNNPQEIRARDVIEAQREVAEGAPLASGTGAKPLNWTGTLERAPGFEVEK